MRWDRTKTYCAARTDRAQSVRCRRAIDSKAQRPRMQPAISLPNKHRTLSPVPLNRTVLSTIRFPRTRFVWTPPPRSTQTKQFHPHAFAALNRTLHAGHRRETTSHHCVRMAKRRCFRGQTARKYAPRFNVATWHSCTETTKVTYTQQRKHGMFTQTHEVHDARMRSQTGSIPPTTNAGTGPSAAKREFSGMTPRLSHFSDAPETLLSLDSVNGTPPRYAAARIPFLKTQELQQLIGCDPNESSKNELRQQSQGRVAHARKHRYAASVNGRWRRLSKQTRKRH